MTYGPLWGPYVIIYFESQTAHQRSIRGVQFDLRWHRVAGWGFFFFRNLSTEHAKCLDQVEAPHFGVIFRLFHDFSLINHPIPHNINAINNKVIAAIIFIIVSFYRFYYRDLSPFLIFLLTERYVVRASSV